MHCPDEKPSVIIKGCGHEEIYHMNYKLVYFPAECYWSHHTISNRLLSYSASCWYHFFRVIMYMSCCLSYSGRMSQQTEWPSIDIRYSSDVCVLQLSIQAAELYLQEIHWLTSILSDLWLCSREQDTVCCDALLPILIKIICNAQKCW